MYLKRYVWFFLFMLAASRAFSSDEYTTFNCFFDDHLDDHQLVASTAIHLQKNVGLPQSQFSLSISPQTLPGHRYTFSIRYLGKVGKAGFLPAPLVEVSLFDHQKQIYTVTKGKEWSELYTSFVNEDNSKIEVYCSSRELKK